MVVDFLIGIIVKEIIVNILNKKIINVFKEKIKENGNCLN